MARISSSSSSSAPWVRASATTCAPASARARAAARPMPRDAPVTTATRFARGLSMDAQSASASSERRRGGRDREVGQRRRIVAREAMVGELRLRRIAARLAHGRGRCPSIDRKARRVGADILRASPRGRGWRRAACPSRACRCRRNPGCVIGGLAMRKCTSLAPASRIMRTIFTEVVPRTRLSSTSTMRLPCDRGAVGRVLHAHAELAHRLGRLDEGAAHIVVADDAELVGKAAGSGHSRAPPARRNPAPG